MHYVLWKTMTKHQIVSTGCVIRSFKTLVYHDWFIFMMGMRLKSLSCKISPDDVGITLFPLHMQSNHMYNSICHELCRISQWNGPLARYVNSGLCMRRDCRERFPRHRGLAIPTCITARASRMCGDACRDRYLAVSFDVGGGESVLGIPDACPTRKCTYMARSPWSSYQQWHVESTSGVGVT